MNIIRQNFKDKALKIFNASRAKGYTLADTAYAVADLHISEIEALHKEIESLKAELSKCKGEVKGFRSQRALL